MEGTRRGTKRDARDTNPVEKNNNNCQGLKAEKQKQLFHVLREGRRRGRGGGGDEEE
jgi:hypothetical protein